MKFGRRRSCKGLALRVAPTLALRQCYPEGMKLFLAVILFASLSLPAQSIFGTITDAPQHAITVGGGCDGNGDCSADAGWAEKLSGATYSYSSVELVPNFVQVGSKSTLQLKTVASTGFEQIIGQSGRLTLIVGVTGGAALPTGNSPTFNFSTTEHFTAAVRLGKVADLTPGKGNNYIAVTPYFTQIMGVPNGNTWAVRLHFIHSMN